MNITSPPPLPPRKEKDVKYVVNTFEILKTEIIGIQFQVWKTKFVSQFLWEGRIWHSSIQWNLDIIDIILNAMTFSLQTLFSFDVCRSYLDSKLQTPFIML